MPFVVVDEKLPAEAKEKLNKLGFTVLPLPSFGKLKGSLSSHPDMLFQCLEGKLFCPRSYLDDPEAKAVLETVALSGKLQLEPSLEPMGPDYPSDILFNVLTVGRHLIGRLDKVCKMILYTAVSSGYELLPVKQGYARCSTCMVGPDGAITADPGIAQTLGQIGLDVLTVSNDPILLDGFDHGFVGGASGCFRDKVYFTGSLESLPAGPQIRSFCQKHGFEAVSLTQGPMKDHGGLIFFEG